MGKEFIEYQSENGKAPYFTSTICYCLTQYARNYIKENHILTKDVDKKIRDAVLVDAINYFGAQNGCDFALYTKDLYENRTDEKEVAPEVLLTIMLYYCANYIFKRDLVESVLRNKHMNECREKFNANDGALVIIDFINYIAKQNEYDRIFTIIDLYEKYKFQLHAQEINDLREFLELTNQYSEKLLNGENIELIFKKMAEKYGLKFVAEDGTYHYTDIIRDRVGQSEMFFWDAEDIDKEIYAISYAYAKLNDNSESQVPIVNKKILEMKKDK